MEKNTTNTETTLAQWRIADEDTIADFTLISEDPDSEIEMEIDSMLADNEERIQKLNKEIDRLTNHADSTDVWVSIGSGVISAMIDILYVGELKLDPIAGVGDSSKSSGGRIIEDFITRLAKNSGFDGDCTDLGKVISHLEDTFPTAQDCSWTDFSGRQVTSPTLHHLEDIAHHPTPMGFAAALCVNLFRVGIVSDKDGRTHFVPVSGDKTKLIMSWLPILISGVLYWLSCCLSRKYTDRELSEQPKWLRLLVKSAASAPVAVGVCKAAINWAGHLASDACGSRNTPGGGMGIPGLFLSLMKELSMFPPFCDTNLPQVVTRLYSSRRNDLRAEFEPVMKHLGKQAIPVLINEVLVSSFYFIRRLINQYKEHDGWNGIDWEQVLPFGNRTIARMRTISSGVFTALDMADAAIRAVAEGGGNPGTMIMRMALRVNIVGLGRFVIALGNDIAMGFRRAKMRRIRLQAMTENIYLHQAKIYVLQNKTWIAAQNADKAIKLLEQTADDAISTASKIWAETANDMAEVSSAIYLIADNNPDFAAELNDIL